MNVELRSCRWCIVAEDSRRVCCRLICSSSQIDPASNLGFSASAALVSARAIVAAGEKRLDASSYEGVRSGAAKVWSRLKSSSWFWTTSDDFCRVLRRQRDFGDHNRRRNGV